MPHFRGGSSKKTAREREWPARGERALSKRCENGGRQKAGKLPTNNYTKPRRKRSTAKILHILKGSPELRTFAKPTAKKVETKIEVANAAVLIGMG